VSTPLSSARKAGDALLDRPAEPLTRRRMRAVQVVCLDGPAALQLAEVDEPAADQEHVLIDLRAAGVVYPDVLKTRGLYQDRPALPFVLGQECAGVVRHAPAGSALRPGDRVAAFTAAGAFADVVAVDPDSVLPLPDGISFTQGACLPVNYLTAHCALLTRGRLRAGETVLVHGAAGGVGSAATQLAVALGARVIAVVSSPNKAEVARQAGAAEVVGVSDFSPAVRALTGGRGVDVSVDPVGGDRCVDSLRCLAPGGRLLVVGFTSGVIPTVKVNRLLLTNTDVVGVGWGALAQQPGYVQQQWTDLLPLLKRGQLTPVIGATFDLRDVSHALQLLEDRDLAGRAVLLTDPACSDERPARTTNRPEGAP